jgi:pre-mRNA-splicing helicase BRR2
LQAYISRLKMDGFAIAADMVFVQQSAARLARALFEICLRRGWASLARRTLDLCKAIDRRQWASASPLRQFTPAQGGLSEDVLRKLENKNLPWARYYDLTSTDLGEMVRLPKLGKPLHKLVHTVPRLDVQLRLLPVTRKLLRLDVTLTPDFIWDVRAHGGVEEFWVLVEDADGEAILHAEAFALKARYAEEEHALSFTVPVSEPLPPHFFLRVMSNRWLHSETLLPIPFARLTLPEKFPPPRELLDLTPLPVGALRAPAFEALFTSGRSAADSPASRLSVFNAIQTQVFPALYGSDANAFIAAPSGSGKTVCAEFALLRLWGGDPNARAVYLAPHDAEVRARYEDWELRFGDRGLGKAVVELTGDLQADLKLLEGAHLVLATPPHWDAISRRWKKRRAVQEVRLYVADELHLVGCPQRGATYEAVVMRVRFSSAELAAAGKPAPRILGLAVSVANFRDVAEWIGVAPGDTFAFHPAHRPVPLEVRIQGLDVADYSARLLAMARPAYSAAAAAASAPGASVLVFVPSRRQAQITAIDMLAAAAADGAADRFLRGRASAEDVEAAMAAAGVGDETLRNCLRAGVGYTYEGQAPGERTLVERLYAGGALGVAVAPAAAARGMDASTWGAHCVVVMGTEVWDGKEHRLVDLPVAEVLHMTGRACQVASGGGVGAAAAKCLLLCAANRKDFVKTFLYEPMPVESVLAAHLHNHINAEVVNGVIESKQDALDYLTWTFLYRRLPANPNWYNLPGASHKQLSDFLSDLVDTVVGDLATSQCVAVAEDEVSLSPQSLGSIAAYYYVGYATLEVFATSLTPKTKIRGLLEILCNAAEFDALPLRHGEDRALRTMALHAALPLPPPAPPQTDATRFSDPHVKANLLLQAHLSRRHLGGDLAMDRDWLLERAVVLVKAMVDVISQEGWLKPALAAMELSQMLVQALWVDKDSPLLQVPHVTADAVAALAAALEAAGAPPAEGVFDLAAVEPGLRARALALLPPQLADVARFCNRFPSIEVGLEVEGSCNVRAGDTVALRVTLTREAGAEGLDEGAGLGAVIAMRFPKAKSEGWWLVVGQPAENALVSIKRVPLTQFATARLDFAAPMAAGRAAYKVYLMSDSYVGVDQELDVEINVLSDDEGMAC